MARPPKLPPKNAIAIIQELGSRGCSEKSIAYALGTSADTWRRWKEDYPEILEAFEQARAVEHDSLVGVLYDKAMGGDSIAAMFLLKSRHGYRDGGVTIEDNRNVKIGIMLPQSLNPEQYQQIISTTAKVIENDKQS